MKNIKVYISTKTQNHKPQAIEVEKSLKKSIYRIDRIFTNRLIPVYGH